MIIIVTQDDIDAGTPCSSSRCPVARAATRAYGQQMACTSKYLCFDHRQPLPHRHVVLPDIANAWIAKYDREFVVKPFKFEVELG